MSKKQDDRDTFAQAAASLAADTEDVAEPADEAEQESPIPSAAENGQPGADAPAEESAAPAESATEPTALEAALAERDEALSQNAELMDRFQRAQAEFENLRKRLVKDRELASEYAAMGTIESLLPIVDDFERALDSDGVDPEFKKGLELIYKRVFKVFTRAGLKPVEADGAKFDPNLHHAVDRAAAENDGEDQKILEVYQKGYHFKERLLRPSMVKVAVIE